MKGSAPKSSATGSQVELVKKLKPNLRTASIESRASCQPTKKTSNTTAAAIAMVSHSNARSPKRDGGAITSDTRRSTAGMSATSAILVCVEPNHNNGQPTSKARRTYHQLAFSI